MPENRPTKSTDSSFLSDLKPSIPGKYSNLSDEELNNRTKNELKKKQKRNQIEHEKSVFNLRICFAWMAFSLVLVWIAIDVIFILGQAFREIPAFALDCLSYAVFLGMLGFAIGLLCDIHCDKKVQKQNQAKKDPNSDYGLMSHRIWRLFGSIVGANSGFWLARFVSSDQPLKFYLSDSVMEWVLTVVTVKIIGMLAIVFIWLYPHYKNKTNLNCSKK